MVFVEVCVGSSCYIKGSADIVELLEDAVSKNHLEDEIVLSGCFCSGKCNRIGVTVTVNGEPYAGITKDSFRDFWSDTIMAAVKKDQN